MAKEFLGRGWSFPMQVDGTGRIRLSEYEEDIHEAIWILLSTAKGERVMRPDFGCGIHEHVFDSIGTSTVGRMESSVREALLRYEPRIEILDLDISDAEASRGRLLIRLDYRVRATNNEFNLVYPFYLKEGNA